MTRSLLPIRFSGRLSTALAETSGLPELPAPGLSAARKGAAGAIVFGRLRFLDRPPAAVLADPAGELLERWMTRGDAVLDELGGEYLVAMWDAGPSRALLAVDRFSSYPLFWAQQGEALGFSARPEQAASLAGMSVSMNWQATLAYAYFHMVPAPLSIFHGVKRLDLGEALRIERGRAEVFRYWNPVFDEQRPFHFASERESFLRALREGVAECSAGLTREQVGCFLSGGTDSSTIAGLLTRQYEAPARTFSIGFDVGGYDETMYSRLAAKHFGTDHTEYFLTPDDALAGVEAVATQYEQPFGNSSTVPTYFCATLAREAGVVRMLGGDGGDELYGGNERYRKQAAFAIYQRVPEWFRAHVVESLLFGPLSQFDRGLPGKARSYVEQARQPLPDRLQLRYNLLNRIGASQVFSEPVLDRVSVAQPAALEREVWARAQATTREVAQINQLLAWDFKFTLADSDLPKVTRMCQAAGVEVAFPMLTHALVEHSLHLRPDEKLKGQALRYFFKEALRGFLPDEILRKQKHGFGMPFGDWLLRHAKLRALAEDALRSLSSRGVIREEFLRRLLNQLAMEHAGYYGTMVWVLMILELWLRASPLADLRVERD